MSYEANSRFATDKEFQVVTRKGFTIGTINIMPVPVRGPSDSIYIVPLAKQYRWDLIAEELLGNPNEKWILMRHNRIDDPFVGPQAGDRLLVPTAAQVQYYKGQSNG
jgi:hypothetical protein